MPRLSPTRKAVEVAVRKDAGFDNLAEALKRIGGEVGCGSCGLLGFDVLLRGEDILSGRPIAAGKLKGIQPALDGIDGLADVRIR
ncbi:MAG TPA: hypothetical protein VF549_09075 [Solirubrobacteraceae bacterium]|jgi:hypothetical protein